MDASTRAVERTKALNDGVILFAIVGAAFIARLPRMGLSVANDEPVSIFSASRPLRLIDRFVTGAANHPPAHFYVLHAWFAVFGPGIVRGRWLSVIFGLAAVPVLYLLGRYLFDRTTGLIAALLLSLAPLPVVYSQIARPYSMHLFLSLCATYLFIVAVRERDPRYWWGFVACAALTVYTLYYGVFVIGALAASLVWIRRRHRVPLAWLLGGAALISAVYLPWLLHSVVPRLNSHGRMIGVVPGLPVHWYTPITILNRFNSSPRDPSPLWSFAVGGILFTVPALAALRHLWKRTTVPDFPDRESLVFVLILSVLPILGILSLAILHVQFQPRYVLFAAPYYYLLVAYGISGLPGTVRAPLLAAVFLYCGYAIVDRSFRNPANPDTRDALEVIAKNHRAGDCAVFDPLRDILLQWNNDYGSVPFRWTTQTPNLSGCERVWVVCVRQDRWSRINQALAEQAEPLERQSLYGVHLGLFRYHTQTALPPGAQDDVPF
jgi:mannosyltransferase